MTLSEHITAIATFPAELRRALSTLTPSQLDAPYRAGGWTPRQVVHHLADSHMNAFIRMRLMITEDNPTLKPYDQDGWATLHDSTLPIEPSLAIIEGLHMRWFDLLDNLEESALTRTAYHPENGQMTIEQMIGIYSKHGRKHLEHILSVRELLIA